MLKSHTCGELSDKNVGQRVTLAGWVHRRRDHGGLAFVDLRDRSGIVQVVLNPEASADVREAAEQARSEWVLQVQGEVVRRPAGTENARIPTGEIEVRATGVKVLNKSKTPPFYLTEEHGEPVDENLRLRYRYLDLRQQRMSRNLELRHRTVKFIRDYLDERGFWEVETPILIKSTPEGARDFLVPSRLQPGAFYALPQSPQQLKQLLMVAGVEKYFQIARCFRDEDLRADRQPEFTQLDLEMSFVEEEDILQLMEGLLKGLVRKVTPGRKVFDPFPRLTYAEAISKYGSDKPDLRFGMEISDLTDIVRESGVGIFKSTAESGGVVRGIVAPGCASYSRRQVDELIEFVRARGAQGLVTLALVGEAATPEDITLEGVRSAVGRYLNVEEVRRIARRMEAKTGDLILIMAGAAKKIVPVLGVLRSEMGNRLNLADPDTLGFGIVTDFPLVEWNEEDNKWDFVHHPFTSARTEDAGRMLTDPGSVRSRAYDFVCNGYEMGGGSIRINLPDVQMDVFKLLGYSEEEARQRFGHLLEAFEFGAPPHGGIAFGIDRLTMVLAQEPNIREVIPFPKTQSGWDPLTGAPDVVPEKALAELGLRLVLPEKEKRQ